MHLETVDDKLLTLLNTFMQWEPLRSFVLVGGTSLSLRTGYRESNDIDLFSHDAFDSETLRLSLELDFTDITINSSSRVGIFAICNGVKVDLVRHPQQWLRPHDQIGPFRLASLDDISAMKIYAVQGRGSKKDFSDLLFLHDNGITLRQSLENYKRKYGNEVLLAAVKSLNYFEDTKGTPDPIYRNGWTWSYVYDRMKVLARDLSQSLVVENSQVEKGRKGTGGTDDGM